MQASKLKIFCAIFFSFLYILVAKDIPLTQIQSVPPSINITQGQIDGINSTNLFGKYITLETDALEAVSAKGNIDKEATLDFKLFGVLPINSVMVNVVESDQVYLGGNAVGFIMNSDGVIVVGSNSVLTKEGKVNTLKTSDIQVGDIIKEISGEEVEDVEDIERIINSEENMGKELEVKAKRKNKKITTKLKPALDLLTKKYKVGLWIKNDTAGVGTLTYIRKDNNRFGALGHPICDTDTKVPFEIDEGKMFSSKIIGVKKGRKGSPGELKGVFSKSGKRQAIIDKNCKFGVFGTAEDESDFLKEDALITIGGRLTAKPGKAKIRANVDGNEIKEYDIEIIKTNYQSASKQKSMVIRVTDKELLKKTGGIVQGMSGSPILQEDKIVGAVTHVFINDPTKGFGVYLDWMLNE